jgi:Holliday junction resolvase-like predicted endonuclease
VTTNYASGHRAEVIATKYLISLGFEILNLNWRTRYCEIDIVAQHLDTVYLVEVKSRRNDEYGSGLDYITPKKLRQMTFSAEMWVSDNKWEGDYQLSVIELRGSRVVNFIKDM